MILLACAVRHEIPRSLPDGVEALVTGVGPVEAACAVATRLARQRYDLVISAGIAGAFDGAARIGDGVAVAEERLELDLETAAPLALPEGDAVCDRAFSDRRAIARMRSHGIAALRGVTVSRVTATEETAARLCAAGAQVETMEGFAVLRAAELAATPAIELRGISNRVGDRERSGWDFAAGLAGLQRVLETLFVACATAEAAP